VVCIGYTSKDRSSGLTLKHLAIRFLYTHDTHMSKSHMKLRGKYHINVRLLLQYRRFIICRIQVPLRLSTMPLRFAAGVKWSFNRWMSYQLHVPSVFNSGIRYIGLLDIVKVIPLLFPGIELGKSRPFLLRYWQLSRCKHYFDNYVVLLTANRELIRWVTSYKQLF
jgi:hypothetical protein